MSWFPEVQSVARALAFATMLFALPTFTSAEELTLDVPALGVSAVVETIEVVDGSLGTPSGPDNVGALQLTGNLLVVGHRDWDGRLRAFGRLERLQPGDAVEFSDGRTYAVEASDVWNIDDDQGAWFAAIAPGDGDALTLISCTGPFSVSRHEYLQRVVVRAERIDVPVETGRSSP